MTSKRNEKNYFEARLLVKNVFGNMIFFKNRTSKHYLFIFVKILKSIIFNKFICTRLHSFYKL